MDKLYGKRKAKRDQHVRDFEFQHPHYTQEQVAQAFGIDQSTVSKILKEGENDGNK